MEHLIGPAPHLGGTALATALAQEMLANTLAAATSSGDYSVAAVPSGLQSQAAAASNSRASLLPVPRAAPTSGGGGGGDYSDATAVGQAAAAATAAATAAAAQQAAVAAAAAAAAAAADDPGSTPAHPRAVSRLPGLFSGGLSAGGVPAEAVAAAAAADGAAGLAAQFDSLQLLPAPAGGDRVAPAGIGVQGALGGGGALGCKDGRGGRGPVAASVAAAVSLEALVYHPSDSVMKPIVGNRRCVTWRPGAQARVCVCTAAAASLPAA